MKKIIFITLISILTFSACLEEEKTGCKDSSATNFDSNATIDCDGCCQYPSSMVKEVNFMVDFSKASNSLSYEWFTLNIDGGSKEDVGFKSSVSPTSKSEQSVLFSAFDHNSISLEPGANSTLVLKQYQEGDKINFDEEEFTETSWIFETQNSVSAHYASKNIFTFDTTEATGFEHNQTYYIGLFVHDDDGNTTNGWIKIRTLDTDYQLVVEAYGYSPVKNQGVLAGQ